MPTIEEQRQKLIAEQIQKMAGTDAPQVLPRSDEKNGKKSSPADDPVSRQEITMDEYRSLFLSSRTVENRMTFSCDRELLECLRHILNDLRAKTTLSAYIGNILSEHIEQHRELLSKAIEKNRRKTLIP
ncbi:conjugal transfer protein TraC [Porphyromonas gingivalis SJD2]|uniref:Conjugative transposon protein TraC n=1 Tax=Porphyromonas gingivalis (strain ATCC BAA-308 / W83) TaxID=242619 RepID=Q7MUM3_PORGI|nr:DUF3408 domain-containing protein [Porphyromonas gingivalis]AAQ66530.1 conjugative transposon protein TraC [Porphyromonas gingivalis W83]AIJ34779.1 conjugal transfer protein TraC [Porphyromonas gingivalis]AKV63725.1 Protein of unknown function (DUF3408) [Porphyromonas gingivalis]AUR47030.1 conjugal transfer protein TraC [Porphyromonas gingivalis]EIW92291.1 PF11888 family protein [Porphyromonas gingivalis W50]